MGFDMGLMMPCLIMTRGLVPLWKLSFVDHSGPKGNRRDRSYCCLVSNSCGNWLAMYFLF